MVKGQRMETKLREQYEVDSTTGSTAVHDSNVPVECSGCGDIIGHYVSWNGEPRIKMHGSSFLAKTLHGSCDICGAFASICQCK